MSRIFITGSTDGLGKSLAEELIWEGHDVILHTRNIQRAKAVYYLTQKGASIVTGDLSISSQVKAIADNINNSGHIDVIVHNAGVGSGPEIESVNVLAPYMLSGLIKRPSRVIFLSSSMHYDGGSSFNKFSLDDYIDTYGYSGSKFLLTTLSYALSRVWGGTAVNAVDPGWVATKMGGKHAPDNYERGYETQKWLAVSDEEKALNSGGYWHYKKQNPPHEKCCDTTLQTMLINWLENKTNIKL